MSQDIPQNKALSSRDLLFWISLILLILNDAYLKWNFPGFWTGKLSDFAGLMAFALFWIYLFPKRANWILILTALGFIWWKSSFSQGFINAWNSIVPLSIERVVDPTDLWAILVLPLLSWLFIKGKFISYSISYPSPLKTLSLVVAVFAFSATSILRHAFPKGDVHIGESYKLKISRTQVLDRLEQMGIKATLDTNAYNYYYSQSYLLDTLPEYRKEEQYIGLVYDIQITLDSTGKEKTNLFIRDVSLSDNPNLSDWRALRDLRNQYEQIIKKRLIQPLQE